MAWEGHFKMTRPERLSFCRWAGRGLSSLRSALSSCTGGFARNRRFGVKAGNRNGSFSASILGSELMLPLDSEGCPALDVSYSVFLLVTKRLGILVASGSGQGRPRF